MQFASPRFEQVWQAADQAVQQGRAARSWTWGPQPWFDYREVYKQSPDGLRLVQYFDKARMEINDQSNANGPLNGVTNGLLVVEMVSGRIKLGDGTGTDQNKQGGAATGVPVAGDPRILPETVTYGSFQRVATTDNGYRDANKPGQRAGATITQSPDGVTIGANQSLANTPGTEFVAYESVTGHNVPRVFDDFRNAGPVPAIAAFGYPITDPYWVKAVVAGQVKDVLVQLFERRSLTYTPANPRQFQVEMGNAGQHYFMWRYPELGMPWVAPPTPTPILFASKQSGSFHVYRIEANGATSGPWDDLKQPGDVIPYSRMRGWGRTVYGRAAGELRTPAGQRQVTPIFTEPHPCCASPRMSTSNDYDPALAPTGDLVFVSDRDGNPELYLVDPFDDNRVIRLTDTTNCAVEHPSWLPDGAGIVYASNCQGGTHAIYRGKLSLTLDAQGNLAAARLLSPQEAERLTTNSGNDRWPRVAPDGAAVAFISDRDGNTEVYSMSSDGSHQTRLTNNAARDEAPTWSPDGQQLAFNSNRDGDFEIFVMNRDGSNQTQMTNNSVDDGYAIWAQ